MNYIIGVDEVGTGAWAGPIVVAAVRAPMDWSLDGLDDSKELDKSTRKLLNAELLKLVDEGVIKVNFSQSNNSEIDSLGLAVCHKKCIATAINALHKDGDTVILDGNLHPKHIFKHGLIEPCNIRSEVNGDAKFPAIMAASIMAKQLRDMLMADIYHNAYPQYGWNKNAGYIVPEHRQAVKAYGLTTFHRKSYKVKL